MCYPSLLFHFDSIYQAFLWFLKLGWIMFDMTVFLMECTKLLEFFWVLVHVFFIQFLGGTKDRFRVFSSLIFSFNLLAYIKIFEIASNAYRKNSDILSSTHCFIDKSGIDDFFIIWKSLCTDYASNEVFWFSYQVIFLILIFFYNCISRHIYLRFFLVSQFF